MVPSEEQSEMDGEIIPRRPKWVPATSIKKKYQAPQLKIYGSVALLTTGGSVNKNENNGHPDGRF